MAGEVLVDALPYIDLGYVDQEVRDAAFSLVEEECRRYRPTKNYLENLPQLNITSFETDLMRNEFERIHNRLPMETFSMKRYELPPPQVGKMSEVSAWSESVDNSMAQLEHQATRVLNLELMLEYGCEAWKAYLEIFTSLQAKAQAQLQDLKKEIQEVNWERKTKQKDAGEKLRLLEDAWVMLVSKNYEIEQACVDLEKKIAERQSELGIDDNIQVVHENNVINEQEELEKENVDEEEDKEEEEQNIVEEQQNIEEEQPEDINNDEPMNNDDTGVDD